MYKITEATVRIVRPNPGFSDLNTELGDQAGESDARRAEITMAARRNASLSKERGIIAWIRERFSQNSLGFAAIKGRRGNQVETFNTEKLGKHVMINIEMDDRGQIIADDAWAKLSEMMDNLD